MDSLILTFLFPLLFTLALAASVAYIVKQTTPRFIAVVVTWAIAVFAFMFLLYDAIVVGLR